MDSFWSKVQKTESCWLWTGSVFRTGYGQFRHPKKLRSTTAHRYAYELANGFEPVGMDVCHACDVRLCVRPDHLFAGSRLLNMRDAVSKGRQQHGARHYFAVLTPELVEQIRRGGLSNAQWARETGLSPSTIREARVGLTWRSVP